MDKDTKKEVKRLINMLKDCIKSELPIFNFFANFPFDIKLPFEDKNSSKKTEIEKSNPKEKELPLNTEI